MFSDSRSFNAKKLASEVVIASPLRVGGEEKRGSNPLLRGSLADQHHQGQDWVRPHLPLPMVCSAEILSGETYDLPPVVMANAAQEI